MQRNAPATPEPSDANCRKATGKSLSQWYAALDAALGVDVGRRALTQYLLGAIGKDEWWVITIAVEYEKARGQKEKDGLPRGYSICSTKTIAAPIATVFAAFGSPALLDRWLGAGTEVQFDEGGMLQNADGDRLVFSRIRKEKDMRGVWEARDLAPGSQVEVLFATKGADKTGVTLNHTRIQGRRDADVLRTGWSAGLEALKACLEES